MSLVPYIPQMKPLGVLYVDVYPYRLMTDGTPEFLIARRNDHVEMPSSWQFLSGKIKEGETIRHAFWRQSQHKLGVEPVRMFKVDFVNTFYDDYYDTVMMVPSAACELSATDTFTLSDLHTEAQWVKPNKLGQTLLRLPI